MKYLDIVIEDVERIKKGRETINKSIPIVLILWIVFSVFSIVFYLLNLKVSAIWIGVLAISYFILEVGLIIKREIYSIMIFLKEK